MKNKAITTVEGHYTIDKKGKFWYYTSINKPSMPVGPFFSADEALDAAQHLENDYHKPTKE